MLKALQEKKEKYKMKRNELLKAVATATGYNQGDIDAVLKATMELLADELAKGETSIKLDWLILGSKMQAAMKARNPKTGETVNVPARLKPTAKFTPSFKEQFKG